MLEEGLVSNNAATTFGAPTSWRFSDLGKCDRAQVLKRLGFKGQGFSPKTLFVFAMGHAIEAMALSWLKRVERVDVLATQVRVVAPQYDAKGRADALGRFGNTLAPIEIKSTRDKALDYAIPYKNHSLQAAAYAIFLGLPKSVLAYIGRDGAMAHAWVQAEEFRGEVTKQWDRLNAFWRLDIPQRGDDGLRLATVQESDEDYAARLEPFLPDRLPAETMVYQRSGKWGKAGDVKTTLASECNYCAYKTLCWGGNANKSTAKSGTDADETTPANESGGTPTEEAVWPDPSSGEDSIAA